MAFGFVQSFRPFNGLTSTLQGPHSLRPSRKTVLSIVFNREVLR